MRSFGSPGRAVLAAALLAAWLPAAGCGYTTGLTLPEGKRTVGVEVFDNQTLLREAARDFHAALTESLAIRLKGNLVRPEQAELLVTGTVLRFARRDGIRNPDNELLESGITFEVQARLERVPRDGSPREVLRESRLSATSGYILDDPTRIGETPSELAARERALANLADRLVLDLLAPLAYETTR